MRLVTFEVPGRQGRIGVLDPSGNVVDIAAEAALADMSLSFDATDMTSLIWDGAGALESVARILATAVAPLPMDKVKLQAPIPRPRKNIFCVGWNYEEHFEEGEFIRPHVSNMPAHPTFFTKAPTSVTGPNDIIQFHASLSEQLDWEAELALVIGKSGKNISESDAMSHVFGYTVLNDGSWRDIQRRHGQQWFKGKSLDGSSPMGPCIVTADALDPSDLQILCKVNGTIKQRGRTSHMFFKLPRIIAELSMGMTLEPGDVIATGTPAGVGHARTPAEFLKPGDLMETEIESIGTLRNYIGPGAPHAPLHVNRAGPVASVAD